MVVQALKVAVIGAGMAGLITARELKREGHRVVIYEKSDRLGGTWVYDPQIETDMLGLDPNREIVHSSTYRSLRVNLSRQLMSFLDYPFSVKECGDQRAYPGHEEVLRYLSDFAKDFGLLELIRFGNEVVRVERVGKKSNEWVIESTSQTIESDEEVFEAMVICNGKHTQPKIADFSGMNSWPGVQIHSHNYRTPEPFHDQIVIIIGDGASAHDLCREISPIAKEVHQVSRSPNVQYTKLDSCDNSWQHSMIECAYEDGKVVFKDGSFVYGDVIIHCTGYKYHFPFLKTNGIVSVDNNRVGPLYKHVFPPCLAPWLSFVGIPSRAVPNVLFELQSKWIAKVLSGKLLLPTEEEMMSSVQQLYKQMEETGWPKHHTHKLQQDKSDYENWLVNLLGLPPLEIWREKLFYYSPMLRKVYGDQYRDKFDVEKWIQEVESERLNQK